MRTAQAHLEQFAPSTAQKNINLAILDELLIPLPPLAEMRCIVDRVELLLTLCDSLGSRLSERDKASDVLAKSLVRAVGAASSRHRATHARESRTQADLRHRYVDG